MATEKGLISSWHFSLDEGGRGRPALSAGPQGRRLTFFPASCPFLKALRLLRQSPALCMDSVGKSRLAPDFLCLFEMSPAEGKHRTKAFQMPALKRKVSISAAGFRVVQFTRPVLVNLSNLCSLRCSLPMLEALLRNAYITDRFMRDMFK